MKSILAIATGGTIASRPTDSGLAPGLSGADIAELVPGLEDIAEVDVVQAMNLDSTNVHPSHWLEIARTLEEHYDEYDGFVVFHGTDTLAYTAAALSYLIQESRKPIVLTGSQKPIIDPFTDAKTNVRDSVAYASDDASHGVSVVFGGVAIEGTRARKVRTVSARAFESIGTPPIASILDGVPLRYTLPHTTGSTRFFRRLDDRVLCLRMTPGFDPSVLDALRASYHALVIEGFGMGGIPEYDGISMRSALSAWADAGKLCVLTTQVPLEGADFTRYEVGSTFVGHPAIVTAGDMTLEACLAKTMWACGEGADLEEAKRLFLTPVGRDRIVSL